MYVVTGASGTLFGLPAVRHLRRIAADLQIVAGSRDPDSAGPLLDAGVEVRRIDFDDPATLTAAFDGATGVLINGTNYGTPAVRRGQQHAAAIHAAVEAQVERIVYTSWPDADRYRPTMMADFAESEGLLHRLTPGAVVLRTTYGLAQTLARDVSTALATGVLAAPAADARSAPALGDELAEAAARVLIDNTFQARTYTLTAADSLDWADLAGIASLMRRTTITYHPINDDQFAASASAQGLPPEMIEILLGVYGSFRAGWTGTPTDDLAAILGREPTAARDAVIAVIDGTG